MTVFIPIKAIIIFVLIIVLAIIIGIVSDVAGFIRDIKNNKNKGDSNACKKKKKS